MSALLFTQCLQNDFVKPIGRFEPLPNRLHVGYAEALRLMGEDPAASWLTYAVIGGGFLLGALAAFVVKGARQRAVLLEQIVAEKENELMRSPDDAPVVPQLIPLDELPPLPQLTGGEQGE